MQVFRVLCILLLCHQKPFEELSCHSFPFHRPARFFEGLTLALLALVASPGETRDGMLFLIGAIIVGE